jgi:hypothetical protein
LSRGGNSGPVKNTPLGDFELFYSSPLFQTSLQHPSCAIPGESLQCLAQD